MKKKNQFMHAVEILAPGDQFIHRAAQRISVQSVESVVNGPNCRCSANAKCAR